MHIFISWARTRVRERPASNAHWPLFGDGICATLCRYESYEYKIDVFIPIHFRSSCAQYLLCMFDYYYCIRVDKEITINLYFISFDQVTAPAAPPIRQIKSIISSKHILAMTQRRIFQFIRFIRFIRSRLNTNAHTSVRSS